MRYKLLLLIFFFSNFFSIVLRADREDTLAAEAGVELLRGFSCSSVGNSTNQAISQVEDLKDLIHTLEGKEDECKQLVESLANFPDVSSIVSQIQNDSVVRELQEQEKFIHNAYQELQLISQLSEAEKEMYPSESSLRLEIQYARAEILKLKTAIGIEKGQNRKGSYINGIEQLDSLAESIYGLNRYQGGECFKKNPGIAKHLSSSLLGISGFFLSQPFGIATSLVGKIMNRIFSISSSSKSRSEDALRGVNRLLVYQGVSCAMEDLSGQQCDRMKQLELVKKGQKVLSEGKICEDCEFEQVMAISEKQKEALISIDKISSWLGLKEVVTDDSLRAASRLSLKNTISSDFSSFEAELLSTLSNIEGKGTRLGDNYQSFSEIASMTGRVFNGSTPDYNSMPIEVVEAMMGAIPVEQRRAGIFHVFTDSPEEAYQLYIEVLDEYNSILQRESSQYTKLPPSYGLTNLLSDLVERRDEIRNEKFKKIVNMSGEDFLNSVRNYVRKKKEQGELAMASNRTEFQSEDLANSFFRRSKVGELSPRESLDVAINYIESIAGDENFLASDYGHLLPITSLKARLKEAKKEADDYLLKSENAKSGLAKEVNEEFLKSLSQILGTGQEKTFQLEMTKIADQYSVYTKSRVAEGSDNAQVDQMTDMSFFNVVSDSMFLQNGLRSAELDLFGAKQIGKSNLRTFDTFFDPYIDVALDYLEKYSPKTAGEDIDPDDHLISEYIGHTCFQLLPSLGLTKGKERSDRDKRVKRLCDGAKITGMAGERKFNDYLGKPFKDRVCAYSDFEVLESAAEKKRRKESGLSR